MQGAFPDNADWRAALDPELDDEARRKLYSDKLLQDLANLARRRDGAAPPVQGSYLEGPFPPTPFFQVAGKRYFILKAENARVRARPGVLGHYIVPVVVTQEPVPPALVPAPPLLSRPFLNFKEIPQAERVIIPPGAPGMLATDRRKPPDPKYCVEGRDFVVPVAAPAPGHYLEVGVDLLREALEQAEALDLAFARRMEGLGNVAGRVVWDCLDPDYDPSDRPAVMEQFLTKYLGRFYDSVDPDGGPETGAVADEALHKHKAFCQAWAKRHYRALTPAVTAPAEALASEFYPYIEEQFAPEAKLTRMELARVLMRYTETAAEFASCLHYFSTGLEQSRGGRNASYKQMATTSTARAASYKRMGDLLGRKLPDLLPLFREFSDPHSRLFHPLLVDWHAILGQMPQVHRFFANTSNINSIVKRARRSADAAAHLPPWRVGRAVPGN
jgi:hypothetical protein